MYLENEWEIFHVMGTYFRIQYPYCYGRKTGKERLLTSKGQGWGVSPGKILIILDMGNAHVEAEIFVKNESHKHITWKKSYGIISFIL